MLNSHPHPDPEKRLMEVEVELKRALKTLSDMRRAAFFGVYDPHKFDEAVANYHEVNEEVKEARKALFTAREVEQAVQATQWQQNEPEFEPTLRMKFIRWMVQTGRLTDDIPVEGSESVAA